MTALTAQIAIPAPTNWTYRIEGAQKIVFFYTGPPSPAPARILTLYAAQNSAEPPPLPPPSFSQPLIARHLASFLLPSIQILLPPAYITQLSNQARPLRPLHRIKKSHISPRIPYAALDLDAAFHFGRATTLVELKPKAAHLSRSKLIPPKLSAILQKFTTPTYHMKNYLIPHARIPVNPYYPADLLSSSLPRVLHAVQTLHAERSRGLRVFHAGKLTSSDSHLTALNVAAHAIIRNNNCSRAILQVQAYDTIDNTGAETIMKHLVDLVGHEQATSLIQQRLRRPFECSDHALEALESSLSYDMPELARQQHCTKIYEEAMQTVKTMSVTQSVAILSRFLQAAVAKDCSMLIALCRKNEVEREDGEVVCVGGVEWMFRIWVVDVGEKSLGKLLHKWGVEDRERATVLANRNLGGSEFSTWKDQATP